MLLLTFKCSKDDNNKSDSPTISLRTGNYPFSNFLTNYATLENGILSFPNWQTYLSYIDYSKNFEADASNFDAANNYLEGNSLEKQSNPVLEVIELMNNFYSSRKKYNILSFQSITTSDNTESYIYHFMHDPYYELTLNEYNEVKIGSLYFRLLDANRTLFVGNSELSKFISTRNQTEFNDFQNGNNVFILNLEKADLGLIFNETEENTRASIKPLVFPDFTYQYQSNGTYKFTNISFFDAGNGLTPIYKWTFSNGNEYTGFEPPDQIFNNNSNINLCTLEIFNFASNNNTQELKPLISTYYPKVCPNGATVTIDIRNEPWFSTGCTVTWDFADGINMKTGALVSHTYSTSPPSNLTKIFNIKGVMSCPGNPYCELYAKYNITNGCNLKGERKMDFFKQVGTTNYKLSASLWASDNIFNGTTGASTYSFVKYNTNSNFLPFYSNICVSLEGSIWLNVNNCCILYSVNLGNWCRNSSAFSISGSYTQSKKVRYLLNELWSTHSLKISNTNFLTSNGILYLQ